MFKKITFTTIALLGVVAVASAYNSEMITGLVDKAKGMLKL